MKKESIKSKKIQRSPFVINNKQWVLLIGLFSILLFGNTIPNNYNLDDELVTINHKLTSKGISAIPEIFSSPYYSDNVGNSYEYRPIVLSTFAIEHQFFGDNPHISHFFNVILYALTCMILFICLTELLNGYNIVLPLLVTLLFSAHPLHSEVVAGIKSRDEILCLLGGISSLLFSLKYIDNGKLINYFFLVLFFLFGMLSKLSVFPLAILIPISVVLFRPENFPRFLLITFSLALPTFFFLPFDSIFKKAAFTLFIFAAPVLFYFLIKNSWKNKIVSSFYQSKKETTDFQNGLEKSKSGVNAQILQWLLMPVIIVFSVMGFYNNIQLINVLIIIALVILYFFSSKATRDWIFLDITIIFSSVCLLYQNFEYPILLFFISIIFFVSNSFRWQGLISLIVSIVLLIVLSKEIPYAYILTAPVFLFLFHYFFNKEKTIFGLLIFIVFSALEGVVTPPYSLKNIILLLLISALIFLHFRRDIIKKHSSGIFLFLLIPVMSINLIVGWHKIPDFTIVDAARGQIQHINSSEDESKFIPGSGRDLNFVEMPVKNSDSFSMRIGTSFIVLGKYFKLLILPHPLGFYYGYAIIKPTPWSNVYSLLSVLIYSVLIVCAIYFFKSHKVFSFGIFFYILCIFSFSDFITPLAGMIGDRLAFVASLGFTVALGYSLLIYSKTDLKSPHALLDFKNKRLLIIVGILGLYSIKTFSRNLQWKDQVTLMRHDIKYLDQSVQANNLLAVHLVKKSLQVKSAVEKEKLLKEAVEHFNKAVEIYPKADFLWFDLGKAYAMLNFQNDAASSFLKAAELDTANIDAWKQAAVFFSKSKNYEKAIYCFQNALKQDSSSLQLYSSLSEVFFQAGKYEQSIEINLIAARIFPNNYEPFVNIGKTYFNAGDKKNSLIYFEKAFNINQSDKNLVITISNIYKELGNIEKAKYYSNIIH